MINIFMCYSCQGQFKFRFLSLLPIHDQHKGQGRPAKRWNIQFGPV